MVAVGEVAGDRTSLDRTLAPRVRSAEGGETGGHTTALLQVLCASYHFDKAVLLCSSHTGNIKGRRTRLIVAATPP